ncbi:Limulus clotting factor C [Operophtera brumata]|uniref:Limulus clotting factor C n=1 Tax=Operophtera brumata TaxID=104452 RepID=A0A0L7KQF6_OPEBR|nr:Limulus clotting factor C [Operophtera brumata]
MEFVIWLIFAVSVGADPSLKAAHCFWTDLEKQLPASQFAVAVGKLHRPWDDLVDQAQKSDVSIFISSKPGAHRALCMLTHCLRMHL